MQTILVTGGAGYIGSIVARKLLDLNYKVKVIDNLIYDKAPIKDIQNKNFKLIAGDIRNRKLIGKEIKDVDSVIHLAAIVGDQACAINENVTEEINYEATKYLARMAQENSCKFIFASSCSVYGANQGILNENSKLNPISVYAKTKLYSENFIKSLEDKNFRPVILRLATLCGKSYRKRFDLVVNMLTAKAIREKTIQIFGGEQWRPNLHVEDSANAFVFFIKPKNQNISGSFNVGSNDQNFRIKEIGNIIKEEIPNINIEVNQDTIDKRDYNVNFDKISDIGYKTQKTVKDAVREIKNILETEDFDYKDNIYNNFQYLKTNGVR